MNYKNYFLALCIYLLSTSINAQTQVDLGTIPDEILQQLEYLSPAEQKRLLDEYNLKPTDLDVTKRNEIPSLGKKGEPIRVDSRNTRKPDLLNLETENIVNQDDKEVKTERFGLSFFSQNISTFAPVDDIAVPDNYMLGIGDSLIIQTLGSSFDRYELQVQRDGNIIIENLGIVSVAGLSIKDASLLIKERFSQQLFGLEVSVNLGNLRAMNIFMAGEVRNPGMYSVSSLTTITQALYQSGGITNLGSLRNIKVLRNGENISTFDGYDLLVYGDSSNDIRLRSGDVVLVQPYERLVTIQGESKRPMIYELLPNENISNLLKISSGLSQFASPNNAVLISKEFLGATPQILTLNLLETKSLEITLGVDDILIIPRANQRPAKYIELLGALYKRGFMGWQKGIYLSDVFDNISEEFPDYADLDFSLISRKSIDSNNREYIPFSLRNLFNGENKTDIELKEFDKIYIFSISSKQIEVKTKDSDDENEFQILHNSTDILSEEGLKYTREELLKDELKIAQINSSHDNELSLISISGAVKFPGLYPLFKDANISVLIKAAGGLLDSAYLKSAELRRQKLENFEYVIELEEVDVSNRSKDKTQTLSANDHLHIRQISDWGVQKIITVSGEVKYPGDYRISSEDTLISVVERAGGFKESAFINGSVYQKEILKDLEVERLRKYSDSLKQTIAASALTQEKLDLDIDEFENIINLLSTIEPTGRIAVNWNSEEDVGTIILDDGDTLFVPTQSNYIQVLGEVNVPNTINHSEDLSVEDYINLAGGLTQRADDNVYVIKANGSSLILERKLYRLLGRRPLIEPGDSIIAPVNIQYTDTLTNWTQITQLIYQSMVSIAAVKGL